MQYSNSFKKKTQGSKNYLYILVIALVIFICACEKSLVFEKNEKMTAGQWHQNDHVDFDVDIADTINLHNFYINLRHGGNYHFSNIFMFISTKMPDGEFFRDTLECSLAQEDGKWYGSGIGDICDVRIAFKKNLVFPLKGKYHFSIEQAMRMNSLPYVFDVGVRIEKSNVEEDKNIRSFFRFQKKDKNNTPDKK